MRRGHFLLESGHHSSLWLDLDGLFSKPRQIEPLVTNMTASLRRHDVSVVCGPLVGGAFLAQLVAGKLGVEFCYTRRQPAVDTPGMYQARYRLPEAFSTSVRGRRTAIVDDVMSAGSALRSTFASLQSAGAVPVVAGALLVLGSTGADFFAQEGLPVLAVVRQEHKLWNPPDCPLCEAGMPIEHPSGLVA
jgi:orotate phosphoribosyltransferase